MNKTILQIPLSKELKQSAEQVAISEGFSSIQEIIRVFLSKLSQNKLELFISEPVRLSSKNDKRYSKMAKNFEDAVNVKSFSSVKSLMNDLRS